MSHIICKYNGCKDKVRYKVKQLCNKHYQRERKGSFGYKKKIML